MIDARLEQAAHPAEADSRRAYRESVMQSRVIVALFLAYCPDGAGLSYIRGGSFLTPDRIAVLLLAGAIILGQGKAFVRDWGPFLLLLFGYELMRGVADNMTNLGAYNAGDHGRILVQSLIDGDKALFFGHIPTLWLQDRLYTPGVTHWYDTGAALIYMLHFVLPLAFGFALWLRDRTMFRRFVLMLLAMSYGAFVFFLLVPAAPPWLAAEWGYIDGVDRPVVPGLQGLPATPLGELRHVPALDAGEPEPGGGAAVAPRGVPVAGAADRLHDVPLVGPAAGPVQHRRCGFRWSTFRSTGRSMSWPESSGPRRSGPSSCGSMSWRHRERTRSLRARAIPDASPGKFAA